MRNIHVNPLALGKFTIKSMGRESAMSASSPLDSSLRSTTTQNKCSNFGKPGHLVRDCRSRKHVTVDRFNVAAFTKQMNMITQCKNRMNNGTTSNSSGYSNTNRYGKSWNNSHNRNRYTVTLITLITYKIMDLSITRIQRL